VIERVLKLKNRLGVHARSAAKIVHTSTSFHSKILLSRGGTEADGKSILGLLTLGGGRGAEIGVRVEGDDENEAFAAISDLINRGFDEKD
jgi:phosphocarrier protein